MVKFTLSNVILLLMISCGKTDEKNKCQTLEQVMIQCIAEGIKVRPEPHLLWTVELDCERQYRIETCYTGIEDYFPYDE